MTNTQIKDLGRLSWISQVGPIQSQESLRIETLFQLWLVGDALEEVAERCHAAGFEHGGRGP